ncbi:MAG TPA: type II secretion system F family protein [Leptolyngbyaceae cyanobacterium]
MNKAQFFHQFAALINAGLPVAQSFETAGQRTSAKASQPFFQQAGRQLAAGTALATVLQAHQSPFTGWEASLLQLGEASGALADISQRLAHQTEVYQRRARLYGSVLTSVIIIALVLLLGLGVLLGANPLQPSPRLLVLLGLLGAALIFKDQLQLSGDLGNWEHSLLRYVPGLKGILEARSQTHLAELALPIHCGLAMDQALDLVRPRVPDPLLAKALVTTAAQVRQGGTLSQGLTGKVPSPTLQMIRTGEETGTLDTMLEKLGEYYEGELERQLRQLEGILRPLSLLAMGAVVLMVGLQLLAKLTAPLSGS